MCLVRGEGVDSCPCMLFLSTGRQSRYRAKGSLIMNQQFMRSTLCISLAFRFHQMTVASVLPGLVQNFYVVQIVNLGQTEYTLCLSFYLFMYAFHLSLERKAMLILSVPFQSKAAAHTCIGSNRLAANRTPKNGNCVTSFNFDLCQIVSPAAHLCIGSNEACSQQGIQQW